jgi:phage nucleotide-binding protein
LATSASAIKKALDGDKGGKAQPQSETRTIAGIDILTVDVSDQYMNWLIYGKSGAGKTVLSGSAEAVKLMSPVLFVDIEGGIKSLRAFHPNVDVVRVKTFKELQRLGRDIDAKGKDFPYRTLVLDSLSEAQKLSMVEIMKDVVKGDPDRDPDIPAIRDWGKNIEQIRRMVRQFRDLPINVIFTALSVEDKDNRNRTVNQILLPGKLSSEIPGFMDNVGFLYVKQRGEDTVRYLLTSQTETTMAKDRTNKLPQVIEEPTMQKLFDYMHTPTN